VWDKGCKPFTASDNLLKVVLAHLSVWEAVTKATFTSIFVRLPAASGKISLARVGKAKKGSERRYMCFT